MHHGRGARRWVWVSTILMLLLLVAPVSSQFLPKPPRDPRPARAKTAFEAGRYAEAADLLESYVEKERENAEAWLFLGWSRYRLGEFSVAMQHFEKSIEIAPDSVDAMVGLGYASLQTEGPGAASAHFVRALENDPKRGDALRGIVLAGRRPDAPEWVIRESVSAARKLEETEGKDLEVLIASETLRAGKEKRLKPPVDASVPIEAQWRANGDYLETLVAGRWQPVFVKGVNLSVALPGRFPSEHPTDEAIYREWLAIIADLGANAVRVYSLLPPSFYKALAEHNRTNKESALGLIQGIWFELPPGNDFNDENYERELRLEIARSVDAVHGNLAIGPRPGRAWGSFDEDVSQWLLSFIIGRNWEPFAVQDFNDSGVASVLWSGEWFTAEGSPMEVWLARLCDYTVGYQANRYRTLNPITFINWPALDPISHPTESSRAEENEWRLKAGLPPIPSSETPWEDDVTSLDSTKISPTEKNLAGIFASYQIYPSFPDFMNHQYSEEDPTASYSRYLADLKSHHDSQPLMVIEFGVSTSRGIAHVHAGGRHHGGHDERAQGKLLAEMIGEIHRHRYAGGLVFSFMDEWSRTTWNTAPFEIPSERGPLWLNTQSPDQMFGLVSQEPASSTIILDGSSTDWSEIPVYAAD